MQSLDNIKENVRKILIEHDDTRENDNLLIFQYWAKFDKTKLAFVFKSLVYNNPELIKGLTSPESIRRCRQKFHQDKQYLPSEAVTDLRSSWEKEFRSWANK